MPREGAERDQPAQPALRPEGASMSAQSEPPRRILLMDDSELALAAAERILEDEGFAVRTADRLGSFNQALREWAPHVVLTDVNMRGVSGVEICKWIRGRLETSSTVILLYSGLGEAELARLAQESGADGYIAKGRGMKHMITELHSLCEGVVW